MLVQDRCLPLQPIFPYLIDVWELAKGVIRWLVVLLLLALVIVTRCSP